MTSLQLFTARQLLTSSGACHAGGGFLVHKGTIEAVYETRAAVQRGAVKQGVKPIDLGACVVTPGLVDAHAHLELSDLRGKLSAAGSFPDWIQSLLAERVQLDEAVRSEGYEAGAASLASSGCTLVGDIDSCGLAASGSGRRFLRVVAYREALDAGNAERRESVLSALQTPVQGAEFEAVSPHSPYTVSHELAQGLARIADARQLALGIHWAETIEESEWLEEGTGPFAQLLASSPRTRGLELLRAAGLLGPRTALFHANHPRPEELEQVRATGASVVHCPGTQAFFERPLFPLARWREAGVNVALGTDSLASNLELDMQRELRLLRQSYAELAPGECFQMATENGARAIGLHEQAGQLSVGRWGDFACFETDAEGLQEILEAVTSGQAAPSGTWIGGQPVRLAGSIGTVGGGKDARRPT